MNIDTFKNVSKYGLLMITLFGLMLINICLSYYFEILIYDNYDPVGDFIDSTFCQFLIFVSLFLVLYIVELTFIGCVTLVFGLTIYAITIFYKHINKEEQFIVYDENIDRIV